MKLALDTGNEIVDPTPAQVEEAIRSLPDRREGFAILSHTDELYIQAAYLPEPRGPGGGFLLEYREGAQDVHYRCDNTSVPTAEVVHAFLSYLDGRDDYKRQLAWLPLEAAQHRERIKVLGVLGAVGLVALLRLVGGRWASPTQSGSQS